MSTSDIPINVGREAIRKARRESVSSWGLERFREVGAANNCRPSGRNSLLMRCPIHNDQGPSLSITVKDGSVLAKCFGACNDLEDRTAWFARLDAWFQDPKPLPDPKGGTRRTASGDPTSGWGDERTRTPYTEVRHPYYDASGSWWGSKVRLRWEPNGKAIHWISPGDGTEEVKREDVSGVHHGDGISERSRYDNNPPGTVRTLMGTSEADLPLYRLKELLGLDPGSTVHLVESESSVDAAWDRGVPATCGPGGASAKPPNDISALGGLHVVLVPDEDEAGSKWLAIWKDALPSASVGRLPAHVVNAATGERKGADLRDLLESGGSVDDLVMDEDSPTTSESPSTGSDDLWDSPPRPLTRYSSQRFPIEVLPPLMRAAAEEVSAVVAVPVAMPATAFLGVASGLVGARLDVAIREGWVRRANLYLCLVADSASGKTPGITPALPPLAETQRDVVAEHIDSQVTAKAMLPALREDIKEARKAKDWPTARRLQQQIDEHEAVLRREARLMVDDITPERLAQLMHQNGGRMVAVNDEGSIISHALGMYSQAPNIDLLLKGADASQSYVADRKGGADGPTASVIERPTITLLAAVQPTVVDRIGAKPELAERGLVGRIMWSWPEDWAGRRMLSGTVATTVAVDTWNKELLKVLDRLLSEHADALSDNGDEVGRGFRTDASVGIRFSDEGLAAYLAWHDAVEAEVPASAALGDIRVFVPKVRDAVAKVSALFAYIEGATEVGADHVGRGIVLGRYWLGEARNLIGSWEKAAGAYSNAERLLRWIGRRPDPLADFTVREARRAAHLKGDEAVAALELLADYGHVRPADPEVGFGDTGREVAKKSPMVEVNPRASAP